MYLSLDVPAEQQNSVKISEQIVPRPVSYSLLLPRQKWQPEPFRFLVAKSLFAIKTSKILPTLTLTLSLWIRVSETLLTLCFVIPYAQ